MVARQTQSPRSASEKVERLGERHDELRRAISQAQPALADSQGNRLHLAGDENPRLADPANGAALAFQQDGSLAAVTSDGTADAAFSAGYLGSSGDIAAAGDLAGLTLHAGVSVLGNTQVGVLTSNVINASGDINAPGRIISTDPAGLMKSANYNGGTFHGVFDNTSDARLKENFTEVDPADVSALLAAPVREWNYTEAAENLDEDQRHVGPVAQDMPAIAVTEHDGRLGIDQTTFLGLLLATVQRQQARIEALENLLVVPKAA